MTRCCLIGAGDRVGGHRHEGQVHSGRSQERRREPLAAAFTAREQPDRAIDVVRARWQSSR